MKRAASRRTIPVNQSNTDHPRLNRPPETEAVYRNQGTVIPALRLGAVRSGNAAMGGGPIMFSSFSALPTDIANSGIVVQLHWPFAFGRVAVCLSGNGIGCRIPPDPPVGPIEGKQEAAL